MTAPVQSQHLQSGLKAHLDNYRGKDLTRSSDRLNALRDVLSRLDKYSFYVVPIAKDSERLSAEVAQALCWQCSGQLSNTRDQNFPSWSWAAVAAEGIRLPTTLSVFDKSFCATVQVQSGSQERIRLETLLPSNGSRLLSEDPRTLCVTSYTVSAEALDTSGICTCTYSTTEPNNSSCSSSRDWRRYIRWDTQDDRVKAEADGYIGLKADLLAAYGLQYLTSLDEVVFEWDLPASTTNHRRIYTNWLLVK